MVSCYLILWETFVCIIHSFSADITESIHVKAGLFNLWSFIKYGGIKLILSTYFVDTAENVFFASFIDVWWKSLIQKDVFMVFLTFVRLMMTLCVSVLLTGQLGLMTVTSVWIKRMDALVASCLWCEFGVKSHLKPRGLIRANIKYIHTWNR